MFGGVLHGGLIAEHDLQLLAVEFAPVREVHDALPVVGELLDVHLLRRGRTGGAGHPNFFLGRPPGLGQSPLPRSSTASHGDAGLAPGPASLLVPREEGHVWKVLLGEGRRHRAELGGHPGSVHHLFFPSYFLILLIQVFQKRVQLILINEAAPILGNEGGTSVGQGHEPHKPTLGMGAGVTPRPSPSTVQGKPRTSPPNQSKELTQPKPCGFALFWFCLLWGFFVCLVRVFCYCFLSVCLNFHFVLFCFLVDFLKFFVCLGFMLACLFLSELYLSVAVSQELAPYLVVEGKDGIELLRGQLHPLGSDKGHRV